VGRGIAFDVGVPPASYRSRIALDEGVPAACSSHLRIALDAPIVAGLIHDIWVVTHEG